MAGRAWKNTYRLSDLKGLEQLDNAESFMESMDLGRAEDLLSNATDDPNCIPVYLISVICMGDTYLNLKRQLNFMIKF